MPDTYFWIEIFILRISRKRKRIKDKSKGLRSTKTKFDQSKNECGMLVAADNETVKEFKIEIVNQNPGEK